MARRAPPLPSPPRRGTLNLVLETFCQQGELVAAHPGPVLESLLPALCEVRPAPACLALPGLAALCWQAPGRLHRAAPSGAAPQGSCADAAARPHQHIDAHPPAPPACLTPSPRPCRWC